MSFPSTSLKYLSESLPLILNIFMAIGLTSAKSEEILWATPGYWIFTASFFPSFSATWTWPMLAAFTEVVLKES